MTGNKKMTGENKTNEQHVGFYLKLRRKMRAWYERKGHKHKWAEYLMIAPDMFYTLVKLMKDPDVPKGKKVKIAGAIVYFISPLDLVPEAIVGPVGYIDDIVLAAYVLDDVINATSPEVVARNWPGEDDVLDVIKKITDMASKILGKGLLKKMKGENNAEESR